MSANATAPSGDLRLQRRALGLSQQALAERVQCSVSMVRLLESGYTPEGSEVLRRVEAVLNDESPAGTPGSRETSGVGAAGHGSSG